MGVTGVGTSQSYYYDTTKYKNAYAFGGQMAGAQYPGAIYAEVAADNIIAPVAGDGMKSLGMPNQVKGEGTAARGEQLNSMMDGKKAPYSYLADDNGLIQYNGVVFVCDYKTNSLCLGDVSNSKNVLNIPLTNGGSLKVNRDNLGQLSDAIGMFSPEDINLIMRAIAEDAKVQKMKAKIEEDTNSLGESADNMNKADAADGEMGKSEIEYANAPTQTDEATNQYTYSKQEEKLFAKAPASVWEAWKQAEEETGIDGYGMEPDGKLKYINQVHMKLLTGQINGEYGDLLGISVDSALSFAKEALYNLENPLAPPSSSKVGAWKEQEKQFYKQFIKQLEAIGG